MGTTNCEKDSLLGQTIPSPEPSQFLKYKVFITHPLHVAYNVQITLPVKTAYGM